RQSCCPCNPDPGPLYMVLDIKSAPDSRIVNIQIAEVEVPSAVRELTITFESGMNETYTFDGLGAHSFYEVNIGDNVASTASRAHKEKKQVGSDSPQPVSRLNRLFIGIFFRFQKPQVAPVNKASLQ